MVLHSRIHFSNTQREGRKKKQTKTKDKKNMNLKILEI